MFASTTITDLFTPRPDLDGYILFEGVPLPTGGVTAAAIAASIVVMLVAGYAIVIIADARHTTEARPRPRSSSGDRDADPTTHRPFSLHW